MTKLLSGSYIIILYLSFSWKWWWFELFLLCWNPWITCYKGCISSIQHINLFHKKHHCCYFVIMDAYDTIYYCLIMHDWFSQSWLLSDAHVISSHSTLSWLVWYEKDKYGNLFDKLNWCLYLSFLILDCVLTWSMTLYFTVVLWCSSWIHVWMVLILPI